MFKRIISTSSSWVTIPIRLALAAIFFAHGAGKVFGSFGGPGLNNFINSGPAPFSFMRPAWLWWGAAAVSELLGAILVFHQIRDAQYRLARVVTFLNRGDASPEASFQIHQSLVGFGSGGVFGTGFGQGQQKLGYLPYAYSDFLFSTIGEEWGFLGVLVVVTLFGVFCWLGFRIAKTAPDAFGQYLATGLTATVALAALLHMSVTLGLMPTTGLAFPFMSYGRSGLVIALVSVGVLINIGRSRGRAVKRDR